MDRQTGQEYINFLKELIEQEIKTKVTAVETHVGEILFNEGRGYYTVGQQIITTSDTPIIKRYTNVKNTLDTQLLTKDSVLITNYGVGEQYYIVDKVGANFNAAESYEKMLNVLMGLQGTATFNVFMMQQVCYVECDSNWQVIPSLYNTLKYTSTFNINVEGEPVETSVKLKGITGGSGGTQPWTLKTGTTTIPTDAFVPLVNNSVYFDFSNTTTFPANITYTAIVTLASPGVEDRDIPIKLIPKYTYINGNVREYYDLALSDINIFKTFNYGSTGYSAEQIVASATKVNVDGEAVTVTEQTGYFKVWLIYGDDLTQVYQTSGAAESTFTLSTSGFDAAMGQDAINIDEIKVSFYSDSGFNSLLISEIIDIDKVFTNKVSLKTTTRLAVPCDSNGVPLDTVYENDLPVYISSARIKLNLYVGDYSIPIADYGKFTWDFITAGVSLYRANINDPYYDSEGYLTFANLTSNNASFLITVEHPIYGSYSIVGDIYKEDHYGSEILTKMRLVNNIVIDQGGVSSPQYIIIENILEKNGAQVGTFRGDISVVKAFSDTTVAEDEWFYDVASLPYNVNDEDAQSFASLYTLTFNLYPKGQRTILDTITIPVLHQVGSSGIGISLSKENIILNADKDGVVYTTLPITSTFSVYFGTSDDSANWSFSKVESDVTGTLTDNVYSLSGISAASGYIDLTATKGVDSITRRINVTKVLDGAQGGTGPAGASAFTVFLTNETHSFGAATDGTISDYSGGVSEIRMFYGTTPLTCSATDTDAPTVDNTYKVTAIANTSGTITFTPSINSSQYKITPSAMTTDEATKTLTIVAQISGVDYTFTKVISYSKSKVGVTGDPGTAATWIKLTPSASTFTETSTAFSPATITVTGTYAGVASISNYEYSVNGGAFSASRPSGVGAPDGNNITTITTGSIASTTISIAIKAYNGSVQDIVTISKVQPVIKYFVTTPINSLTKDISNIIAQTAVTFESWKQYEGEVKTSYSGRHTILSGDGENNWVMHGKTSASSVTQAITGSTEIPLYICETTNTEPNKAITVSGTALNSNIEIGTLINVRFTDGNTTTTSTNLVINTYYSFTLSKLKTCVAAEVVTLRYVGGATGWEYFTNLIPAFVCATSSGTATKVVSGSAETANPVDGMRISVFFNTAEISLTSDFNLTINNNTYTLDDAIANKTQVLLEYNSASTKKWQVVEKNNTSYISTSAVDAATKVIDTTIKNKKLRSGFYITFNNGNSVSSEITLQFGTNNELFVLEGLQTTFAAYDTYFVQYDNGVFKATKSIAMLDTRIISDKFYNSSDVLLDTNNILINYDKTYYDLWAVIEENKVKIDGANIVAGTISSSQIIANWLQGDTIHVQNGGKVGGFLVGTKEIVSSSNGTTSDYSEGFNTLPANCPNKGIYLGIDGIRAGKTFKLSASGVLEIGATLTDIETKFNNLNDDITTLQDKTTMFFNDEVGLIMGDTSGKAKAILDSDSLDFYGRANTETAWNLVPDASIGALGLDIKNGTVSGRLAFGRFIFENDTNTSSFNIYYE